MTNNRKDNSFIDLHLHTKASDGTFSPSEMVEYAKSKNIVAVAITDHDTVAGVEEGLIAGKKMGIEVIPGIEFSTEIDQISFHIVGLFVDHKDKTLLELTKQIQNARKNRAIMIIEKVNALNIGPKITLQEVEALASGLIGRPHIATVMIEKGYAKAMDEVFSKFLERGASCYVPRFKLRPQEAVSIIAKMKAIPILAHPGFIPKGFNFDEFLEDLKKFGLAGIEVIYPSHSIEQRNFFRQLAKKFDLLESGGSDCHGKLGGGPYIGRTKIPYYCLQKMKVRFGKK